MEGLCFFIVGYVLVRKDLYQGSNGLAWGCLGSRDIGRLWMSSRSPCGRALLGGLAEEEADLLEALCEGVFGRHDRIGPLRGSSTGRGGSIGAGVLLEGKTGGREGES